jgi:hypothetical protein
MQRRHRRGLIGVIAVASASFVLSSLPAVALTPVAPPSWPSAGRVPFACATTVVSGSSGGVQATFTDTLDPVVSGWTLNGKTTTVIMPPGGTTLAWRIKASQPCSGVTNTASMYLNYSALGFGVNQWTAIPVQSVTSNAFDQTLAYPFFSSVGYAGWYRIAYVETARRYDTFVLDGDFKYVSSASTATSTFATGTWSNQKVYVLLKTTLTGAASKASVAKGGSVTFKATMKKAGTSAYIAANGSKVLFQTRTGTGAWKTRATLTTNASGVASYTYKPAATSTWRFVHAGEKSTLFTAPITSTTKSIKVT